MAKAARGLPSNFVLDLPDSPVDLGDFLDEAPPVPVRPRQQAVPASRPVPEPTEPIFSPQIVPPRSEEERRVNPPPAPQRAAASKVIRYQLNLTPKSKVMFEELMKHVQMYSPEGDTKTSEVFQGVIGVLHSAMDELDLSGLPRRGAWGSVTAKNFPNALGVAFEQAIVRAARKRGVV